jgi:hypothetical protein
VKKNYMTLLFVVIVSLMMSCSIEVRTPEKPMRCDDVAALSKAEAKEVVKKAINTQNYNCLSQALTVVGHATPIRASLEDLKFAETIEQHVLMMRATADSGQGSPAPSEQARILMLAHLIGYYNARPAFLDVVLSDLPFVRSVLYNGEIESRITATRIISILRSDVDILQIRTNATLSDEGLLFFSMNALIRNCSPTAKAALRELLTTNEVKNYLSKYAGREAITSMIREDCPLNAEVSPRSDSRIK